jgi:hypothetical protein
MKIRFVILILLTVLFMNAKAQLINYISGDISYKNVSGFTFDITLSLCTKGKSVGNAAFINFGDGDFINAPRIDSIKLGNNILKSNYRITHTYSSPFEYTLSYFDTNNLRNAKNDVGNCKSFYVESKINFSNFTPPVNSSINKVSGATTIYKNKLFNYNATEIYKSNFEADSTVYKLLGNGSNSMPCFQIPQGVSFNKYSGEVIWQNPDTLGNYVFYIVGKSYKGSFSRVTKSHYFKLAVVNQLPTFQFTHSAIPLNSGGFKEFSFIPNTTYSFSSQYMDNSADSVRLFVYPLDFYNTPIQYTYTSNSAKNHSVKMDWTPQSIDIRDYPYNVVINARSYYPNDSVANSYQTVSYKYANSVIGIKENSTNIKNGITIFPNPAKLQVSVENALSENYTIDIYDVAGRLMKTIKAIENKITLNISDLASGVYFVKTNSEKQQTVNKLLVN